MLIPFPTFSLFHDTRMLQLQCAHEHLISIEVIHVKRNGNTCFPLYSEDGSDGCLTATQLKHTFISEESIPQATELPMAGLQLLTSAQRQTSQMQARKKPQLINKSLSINHMNKNGQRKQQSHYYSDIALVLSVHTHFSYTVFFWSLKSPLIAEVVRFRKNSCYFTLTSNKDAGKRKVSL